MEIDKKKYLRLAKGLNTSLTPLTDLKILKELRAKLGISSKPRCMDGWAAATTAQNARTVHEVL